MMRKIISVSKNKTKGGKKMYEKMIDDLCDIASP